MFGSSVGDELEERIPGHTHHSGSDKGTTEHDQNKAELRPVHLRPDGPLTGSTGTNPRTTRPPKAWAWRIRPGIMGFAVSCSQCPTPEGARPIRSPISFVDTPAAIRAAARIRTAYHRSK